MAQKLRIQYLGAICHGMHPGDSNNGEVQA